jgi:hypothetical protein
MPGRETGAATDQDALIANAGKHRCGDRINDLRVVQLLKTNRRRGRG